MDGFGRTLVAVSVASLRRAEQKVRSCETCDSVAEIPFHWLLDGVSSNPAQVDYILAEPGTCPRCRGRLLENTRIECHAD